MSAPALIIMSGVGMKRPLLTLEDRLRDITGVDLHFDFEIAGRIRDRVLDDAACDIVVLQSDYIDELCANGRIDPRSVRSIARPVLAAFVPTGNVHPDIGTVEAFKHALLAARRFGSTDPASGGISGMAVAALLSSLGVNDAMHDKLVLGRPEYQPTQLGANGEIDLGVVQLSEILDASGIDLVAPLPQVLQPKVRFDAGIATRSTLSAEATAALDFLQSPEAMATIVAAGLQPLTPCNH